MNKKTHTLIGGLLAFCLTFGLALPSDAVAQTAVSPSVSNSGPATGVSNGSQPVFVVTSSDSAPGADNEAVATATETHKSPPAAPAATGAKKDNESPWTNTLWILAGVVGLWFVWRWLKNKKDENSTGYSRGRPTGSSRSSTGSNSPYDQRDYPYLPDDSDRFGDRDGQNNFQGRNMGPDNNHVKSPARLILPNDPNKKTFKDVAGQPEAVDRLKEVCHWLKEPEVYNRHDAKLPRGILLSGPPGTGKTLLARALAGEAQASMYTCAGSAFVEVYVGVGAGRIREMFQEAKQQAKRTQKPVIIFIDEIDALGGKRSNGASSNSEREQTLNQLLVEMDGFEKNESIIVMAATNRPDMLDEALTRKGRFDMDVPIDLPDTEGREAIFKVHSAKKPLAEDLDFSLLAQRTFGFSGSDIEAACNEAAIIAARAQCLIEEQEKKERAEKIAQTLSGLNGGNAGTGGGATGGASGIKNTGGDPLNSGSTELSGSTDRGSIVSNQTDRLQTDRTPPRPPLNYGQMLPNPLENLPRQASKAVTRLTNEMFDEAISIVEAGEARRSRLKAMKAIDKKQTAYHELGHAVVNLVLDGDPITKITILPRGRALGFVQTHTDGDRFSLTDTDMRKRIAMALAGRAAQEIFMQTVDTGASNDFKQANQMALQMVTEYGMSPLGAIYVPGFGMQGGPQVGSELANEIDRERRKVVSDCDKQCREIIEQYRKVIEDLAVVLLAKDTILGPDFLKLFTESKAKHVDAAKSVQSAAESQDKPE